MSVSRTGSPVHRVVPFDVRNSKVCEAHNYTPNYPSVRSRFHKRFSCRPETLYIYYNMYSDCITPLQCFARMVIERFLQNGLYINRRPSCLSTLCVVLVYYTTVIDVFPRFCANMTTPLLDFVLAAFKFNSIFYCAPLII